MVLATLLVAVFVIFVAIPPTTVTHLDGTREILSRWQKVRTAAITLLVSLPVLAAALGALVALIPRHGLPYRKKYVRSWLLTLIALYGAFGALGAIKLLRIYAGV